MPSSEGIYGSFFAGGRGSGKLSLFHKEVRTWNVTRKGIGEIITYPCKIADNKNLLHLEFYLNLMLNNLNGFIENQGNDTQHNNAGDYHIKLEHL